MNYNASLRNGEDSIEVSSVDCIEVSSIKPDISVVGCYQARTAGGLPALLLGALIIRFKSLWVLCAQFQ